MSHRPNRRQAAFIITVAIMCLGLFGLMIAGMTAGIMELLPW